MRIPVRPLLLCLFVGLVVMPAAARLQPGRDAFERALFKPELLIANQREIGLTEDQREVFIREMRETQGELLPAQLEMSRRLSPPPSACSSSSNGSRVGTWCC